VSEVKYFRPKSYKELNDLLDQLPDFFLAVAGTTDFIPATRNGAPYPDAILDISQVAEFLLIKKDDLRISIGAAVTMADLFTNKIIVENAPALASAAKSLGAPQTRNRATIGGNIANASPSADTAPVLLTLNADVHFLAKDGSTRQIPLTGFFQDYKKTAMRADEIITGFSFDAPASDTWSRFAKIGQRNGATISVVNMAVLISKEGTRCTDLKVAFGAVGPVPLRSPSVESLATGKIMDQELIGKCAKALQLDISPISDIRGSAEYRRDVAANILARALTDAFA